MVICDPFKGLSDLQLGDEKGTLNHLVDFVSEKNVEFSGAVAATWCWTSGFRFETKAPFGIANVILQAISPAFRTHHLAKNENGLS